MMKPDDDVVSPDESSGLRRSLRCVGVEDDDASNNDEDEEVEEEEEESLDELIRRYTSYKRRHHHDKDDDDEETDSDYTEEEESISKPFAKLDQPRLEAPEFIERLRGYNEASVGTSVTFVAQFKAFPVPTVKWFKDEEEVCPTERHQLLSSESEGTLRLTINDVTFDDEGAYKCKVENQEGVASTTGYLSVTGCDLRSRKKARSTSSRSNKMSPSPSRSRSPAVSSPPALRSIIENRSIEESEELELYRQPPSPLQSFIDNIRHSAKSRHPPIFYGTDDLLFGVGEIEGDLTDCLERQNTLTGDVGFDDTFSDNSKSIVEAMTMNVQRELAVPVTVVGVDSNLLIEESRHDKPTAYGPAETNNRSLSSNDASLTETTSRTVPDSGHQSSSSSSSSFHLRRLGRLQHRLAIDLPEFSSTSISSSDELRCRDKYNSTGDVQSKCSSDDSISSSLLLSSSSSSTNPCSREFELEIGSSNLSEVFLRVFFATVDSQIAQLYTVLVTVATVLANSFVVPPFWLIVAVAASSLVSFQLFDEHRVFSPRTTPSNSVLPSRLSPCRAIHLVNDDSLSIAYPVSESKSSFHDDVLSQAL